MTEQKKNQNPQRKGRGSYIHFPAGTKHNPLLHEFMQAFNSRNFERAQLILDQGKNTGQLSAFDLSNLSGVLETELGSFQKAEELFLSAREYARTETQKILFFMNVANIRLKERRFEEAAALCREGIQEAISIGAPMEVLWCNLLIALEGLKDEKSIEIVIKKLPLMFDLSKGNLRTYLLHDNDFKNIRSRSSFQEFLLPILEGRKGIK